MQRYAEPSPECHLRKARKSDRASKSLKRITYTCLTGRRNILYTKARILNDPCQACLLALRRTEAIAMGADFIMTQIVTKKVINDTKTSRDTPTINSTTVYHRL